MIVVAGEALVDLIGGDGTLRPFPGGGPYNTAVALGRLGVPTAFFGRISTDRFGRLLAAGLADSGVDDRYVLRTNAPTPLALVHDGALGGHEFGFYLAGTAYADVTAADLPELDPGVAALCSGTLALATDPPATAIETLLEREAARRLVVIDPNVRPAVCADRDAYRRRFERWATMAHVVKLSAADAAWLYPDEPAEQVLERLLARGCALAVLTRGGDGAAARTADARAEVPAVRVDVVDTVGAGDAFGAGLLCRLWELGRLDAAAVAALSSDVLADALRFAAAVAGLQCARAGAVPPSLAEVASFLGRAPASA